MQNLILQMLNNQTQTEINQNNPLSILAQLKSS